MPEIYDSILVEISDNRDFTSILSTKTVAKGTKSIQFDDLDFTKTYYCRTRKVNKDKISFPSEIREIKLSAPTIKKVSAIQFFNKTKNSFSVAWSHSGKYSTFDVSLYSDAALTNYVASKSVSTISASFDNLSPNTTYYVKIITYYRGYTSGEYETASITTSRDIPSNTYSLSAYNILSNNFYLSWEVPDICDGIYLDVAEDSGFVNYIENFENAIFPRYYSGTVIGGLTSLTTYYYRVRWYNESGISDNSSTGSITTQAYFTRGPYALSAYGINYTLFNAAWSPLTSAEGYYLDVSTNNTFTGKLPSYDNLSCGDVTYYEVNGLDSNTNYYYRIRGKRDEEYSTYSNIINVKTSSYFPTAPTAIYPNTIGSQSFTALWSSLTNATEYYIDVATDENFSNIVSGYNGLNVGDVVSYEVTGLDYFTNYCFRVRGKKDSEYSAYSNTVRIRTLQREVSIITWNSTTNIGETSARINWNHADGTTSENATYYLDIARDDSFTNFISYNLSVGYVNYYDINSLTAGNAYYCRIRTYRYDWDLYSNYSSTGSFTTNAEVIPTISITGVNNGMIQYLITISVSPIYGYYWELFRDDVSYDEGSISTNVLSINGSTNKIITNNSTYKIRVRRINGIGIYGSWSNWSNSIYINVNSPSNLNVSGIGETSARLNWNHADGTTSGNATYYLDIARDSSFTNFVANNLSVGYVNYYDKTGLVAGTTYYYRIRTYRYDYGLYSNYSSTGSFNTTIVTLPAPPTIEFFDVGPATYLLIAYSPEHDVNMFYLYNFSEDINFSNPVVRNEEPNIVPLIPGPSYIYVRAAARNSAGTGAWSSTYTAPSLTPLPNTPATYSIYVPVND